MLAVVAALVVVMTASPAWAAGFTVNAGSVPSKIFYNVSFTISINAKNETGAPVTNPHPIVFLYPTPNLPGGKCNPAFRASMAELTRPLTPISEHETTPGDTNCYVWWGFDLSQNYPTMLNGASRTWGNVKITARPPAGITALNLRVMVINPAAPDEPYGSKTYTIPVATLPVPPTPITPTTAAPPTAAPTEEPFPSENPTPDASAGDAIVPQPSLQPTATDSLLWVGIVGGIALVTIGLVLIVLLVRWRSRPDTDL
jgi:hypothetical protein